MNRLIEILDEKKEELMRPCTIIAGASTLVLNETNHLWLPALDLNPHAITIDNDKKSIHISKNCLLPLVIDCLAKQVHITIEEGADVQVVFKTSLKNGTHLTLKDNSKATFYFIGQGPYEHNLVAQVKENAELKLFEIKTSVEQSINTIDVDLLSKDAEVSYWGLDVLCGLAQKSTALTIYHRAERTKSFQTFRGIYGGSSNGKFLGKVVVEKPASLSKASQLYRSVILGSKAKAHTMPQLEIYNHDISASHGASIGELDKNSLFYLCSRGLSLAEAKALLVRALVNDVLEQVCIKTIKTFLSPEVNDAVSRAIEDAA